MTYIPAQYRVRVELSGEHIAQSPTPPPELILRARRKLENEVNKGRLEFYRFFESRLHHVCTNEKF